jgi:ubiquinone/menaquinone biosynthesis C-methylase UbiE
MLGKDSEYFQELQTQTGWGKTLDHFAAWCNPQPGWVTLDVGCGPGLLPAIFSKSDCQAIGVDLDLGMFRPQPLHSRVVVADVFSLPFPADSFNLVTCSNLLFLLSEPVYAMEEIRRLVAPGGRLAMLNPSENLHDHSAGEYAREKGLHGMASATLLNWANRAVQNHRWTETETGELFTKAGFKYMGSTLRVGPGFARFSRGTAE